MIQMEWKNYSIKNHFLYIIYISFFIFLFILFFSFFFSSKYKHGKNEVTVNVQVPKQKKKIK